MLKIRLQRVGRKHDPSFRVVLTDSKNGPKSGKFLEILGHYDPKKDVRKVDGERVNYWVSKGAQVSDTVHNILVTEKIIEGKKINVLPKKSPIVSESAEEEKKVEAEAPVEAEETITESVEAEVVEDPVEEKVEEKPVEEKAEETKEENSISEESKVEEEKTDKEGK